MMKDPRRQPHGWTGLTRLPIVKTTSAEDFRTSQAAAAESKSGPDFYMGFKLPRGYSAETSDGGVYLFAHRGQGRENFGSLPAGSPVIQILEAIYSHKITVLKNRKGS